MMWLFRAFCDEKVRAERDGLKADLKVAESRLKAVRGAYAAANKALAAAQLDAQAQQHSADRTLAAVKDAYRKQLADRDEQLDRANGYVGELEEALRERDVELDATREQLDLSQRGGVSLARTAKALAFDHQATIARLERRWAMHADRCQIAQQLDDVDRDKSLENDQ